MQIAAPLPPAAEELGVRRLVLRDGTVATVRESVRDDAAELTRFFQRLSIESRRNRFFSNALPSPTLIARFADSSNPAAALTLVVSRGTRDEEQIIAAASYIAGTHGSAEVAFAVDDRFQGRGISTLLLEQLAARAAAHGFERFSATTLTSNLAMREVFRDAGLAVRTSTDGSVVDVQIGLTPSPEGVAAAEARRRLATIASMRPLLAPTGIAVIGASRDDRKVGSRILHAIITGGYRGAIYPVHPLAEALHGAKSVRSARDLPAGVDAAVIAVPAAHVSRVVDDCAAAGVKALIVVTAGFAETGDAGRAAQEALTEQVRGHGMRMIGPNGLGLLNASPEVRLNASFAPVVPPAGHIALSSQSGAVAIALLEMAAGRNLGVSAFVSVGNKADVSSNDLLEYWEQDPQTRTILLYLESFGNPRRFARIARRVARAKPIVALKAGRTTAGSRAAHSHTAAVAASDAGVDSLFHQAGVVRVDTIDEMFDVAACLDAQPLPRGRRVAIVTNAGGPGILATDACEAAGLSVLPFGAETQAAVRAAVPAAANVANPVDMVATASGAEYQRAIEIALSAGDTDAVIVVFTPVDATRVDDVLAGITAGVSAGRASGRNKPVLACLMAEALRAAPLATADEIVPSYVFPENAVRALAKATAYAAWQRQPAGSLWSFDDIRANDARAICDAALAGRGAGWLSADETTAVLNAYGLPLVAARLVRSPDEAVVAARAFGFPAAAKLASTAVSHKSEVGGVRLDLVNDDAVAAAFDGIMRGAAALPADAVQGVIIQPMVKGGSEMIVGVSHDPVFGPLVGFGTGGVDVEILRDMRFRIAPLTDRDAEELLREIRGFARLTGSRGRAPADLGALRDVVLRVSRLAQDLPTVCELDLNPVLALPEGCRIVDARVRVA